MLRQFLGLVALLSVVSGLAANELSIDAVNSAEPNAKSRSAKGLDALIVKTQVLLDRAHFSPGEIDGKQGDNLQKALRAYAGAQAIASDGRLTDELWASCPQARATRSCSNTRSARPI
jgi:peptidoglycan hydrolase-like protein with peptidoglycan-binding domain